MRRAPDKAQSLQMLIDRGVPMPTILDVGVLQGTPELIKAFPSAYHVLFEPVAEFQPAIEAAYQATPHILVNAAVSNSSGETTLALDSIIEGVEISHSTMLDLAGESGLIERTVTMITVDDWVAVHAPPSPFLLKIDIDGHELRVLEGARETLKRTSVVMIETPVRQMAARIDALDALGFDLFDLIEPVYYDGALWQCDALMISRDIKDAYFADLTKGFDLSKWQVWSLEG